ncbi:antitoxin [Philodulcilactobacillus myokoensis]|uniref:Antitoxin n=1 Tax=Philodulcilactobacillus myokoensis TaxID=2929573 RepID=A0A9W6B100_9LACO|nr:type II toxin-antitoxin system Phd/YefM family antitoxin [Philodulcilactobacillus myokoensis]GLB46154.1 antitoxin [Philodulcilactobacillus myokoensis]
MTNKTFFSPTSARQKFFGILKQVNENHSPVMINSSQSTGKEAVIMSKSDYDALQETMSLMMNGQLPEAIKREKKGGKVTPLPENKNGNIDWSKI